MHLRGSKIALTAVSLDAMLVRTRRDAQRDFILANTLRHNSAENEYHAY